MRPSALRWLYLVVGVVVLLFAGLVYAWSVFSQPIAAEFADASVGDVSLTFTICMMSFCLGGFVGGLLAGRLDVRVNVWTAAVLFLAGFLVAARAESLPVLYVGYGVMAGFASGLAYNAVMSTMSSWFPDKQGLASGILLMGFGLGSFIIGKVFSAFTPDVIGAWRSSFTLLGVVLAVVLGASGFFFVKPSGADVPSGVARSRRDATAVDVPPARMVRTRAFWFFFAWAVLLSATGLAVIGQGSGVVAQVGSGAIDAGTTATLVGLISIFNALGRVLFGGMFDAQGHRKTMLAVDGVFLASVAAIIASVLLESMPLLVVGFVSCGLSYGGITSTNSAFINSFFGAANYPVNFSIVNLNLILASSGGTIAGVLFDMSGSYLSTFLALACAVAVATVCTLLIGKRPVAA